MWPRIAMHVFTGVLVLVVGLARCAAAQEEYPTASLTLVAGPTHYSLQGRHGGGLIALRLASPLVPLGTDHWLVEPNMGYESYRADSGQRRHVLVSEVQLQARTGATAVQPYAGLGGGLAFSQGAPTPAGRHPTVWHLTFSAGVGIRVSVARSWGVAGELRIRRLALFQGWTRELTAGLLAAF